MAGHAIGSDAMNIRRRKSAYPLPGGYDAQLKTLATILDWVVDHKPDPAAAEAGLAKEFRITPGNTRLALLFLDAAGLLATTAGIVEPSQDGSQWRATGNALIVVAALHRRIQFVGEMIARVVEPRRPEEILILANRDYGVGWETVAQVNIRRGWLQSAGALMAEPDGRLVATEFGRTLLGGLQLEPPRPAAPSVVATSEPSGTRAEVSEPISGTTPAVDLDKPEDALEQQLRETAKLTNKPVEFERVVAAAFRDLGFEATNLGGSGKTDVLLVAELARPDGYRVIIDCKTTSHEAVDDLQIDWVTLSDHRKKHEADFVAVVAGAFAGARIRTRAREHRVTLVDLDGLTTWRRQHMRVPMGLDTYRLLFEGEDFDLGMARVADDTDSHNRLAGIAAAALAVIARLEGTEGPVSARDVYWNIRREEGFETVTTEELESLLGPLSLAPVSLLRRVGEGYRSIGSAATQKARLRRLAELMM